MSTLVCQPVTYNNYACKWRIIFMLFTALCLWAAPALQCYITLSNYPAYRSLVGVIIQLFSYFTIIINILAAISVSSLLIAPNSAIGKFFGRPAVLTAIAVYIAIVGLVYSLILRGLWSPAGMAVIADEMLHTVNPILYTAFWLLFVNKQPLEWRSAFSWLWLPFIYMVYIVIRGEMSHMYPYPFIDINVIGYLKAFINAAILLIVFWAFNAVFIYIGKQLSLRQR